MQAGYHARMPSITKTAATVLLTLALSACASRDPRPAAAPVAVPAAPSLLLISIDGFRADYLDRGITPNLARIEREGVRAAWMTPSYPSLTFPNHYTLVTGLRPDRHGMVHNTMRDATLGTFKISDRDAVANGAWWGGEPIWVGASKAGLPSATLYWPGSEAPIQGVRPTRWKPFDASVAPAARADQVLAWLSEPEATRPRVVTLYFDSVDHAGHDFGPDSQEVRKAMMENDAALGRLLDGLSARGQLDRVNIVVVSDHGMAPVPAAQTMAVEDIVTPAQADVITIGQSIGIAPKPGHEAEVEKKLLGAHKAYECWRKGELPERWHYGRNPRVPPLVCQMREGWDAIERSKLQGRDSAQMRGSHGFDPTLPSMRAIFLARGPAFVPGTRLPGFDNVDVYPLLARLIGIPPAQNDGDLTPLLPALRVPGPAAN